MLETESELVIATVIGQEEGGGGGVTGAILIVRVFTSVAQPLVADIEALTEPGAVGVPEMMPVEEAKESPGGKEPMSMVSTVGVEVAPVVEAVRV